MAGAVYGMFAAQMAASLEATAIAENNHTPTLVEPSAMVDIIAKCPRHRRVLSRS